MEEELSNGRDGAERLYQLLWEGLAETVHSTEPDLESVFMELTGRKLNL